MIWSEIFKTKKLHLWLISDPLEMKIYCFLFVENGAKFDEIVLK